MDDYIFSRAVGTQISLRIDAWWEYMDVDCDGTLEDAEAVNATAQLLAYDPHELWELWSSMECEDDNGAFKPDFVTNMVASFAVTGGRVDWGPCRFAKNAAMMDSQVSLWTHLEFQRRIDQMLHFVFTADRNRVQARYGLHLCQDEWHNYIDSQIRIFENSTGRFGNPVQPKKDLPTFLDMKSFCEDTYHWYLVNYIQEFDRDFLNLTNGGGCIQCHLFGAWSVNYFRDLLPFVNASERCFHETSSNTAEQSTLMAGLFVSSGIVLMLCFVMFLGCFYHRKYRRKCQQMRYVQGMLKAKIDTWSTFDDHLRSRLSSLDPSFAHCLGLSCCQLADICLQDIVHPDDKNGFLEAFAQLKQNRSIDAPPVTTTARLKFGFRGYNDTESHSDGRLQDSESYLHAELLMSWGQGRSIAVGLTCLNSVHDNASATPATLGITRSMSREFILNDCDQASSSGADARTFISMQALDHRGGLVTKLDHERKAVEFRTVLEHVCAPMAVDTNDRVDSKRICL